MTPSVGEVFPGVTIHSSIDVGKVQANCVFIIFYLGATIVLGKAHTSIYLMCHSVNLKYISQYLVHVIFGTLQARLLTLHTERNEMKGNLALTSGCLHCFVEKGFSLEMILYADNITKRGC